jgi:phosphatidylserine synthase
MGALVAAVLSILQSFFQYLIPWALMFLAFNIVSSVVLPKIFEFLSNVNISLVQTFTGLAGYFISVLKLDVCFNLVFSALATATVIRFIRRV